MIILLLFSVCAGIQNRKDCSECPDICERAKKDAVNELKDQQNGWFFLGAVLLPAGMALAAVIPPEVPAENIEDLTADQIDAYSDCYQTQSETEQLISSTKGAGFTLMTAVVLFAGFFLWSMFQFR